MAKIPETIGKYRIVSMIARGGMGAVFKAVHPTLKRHVIIKKLTLRGDAAITQRFKREASLMMDFKNEHIVGVYDHFRTGSSYYIVMEFVDGVSLDKLIDSAGPLPDDLALLIFHEASKALKYAHDRGVVHRDIKPANILVSKTGEVKLTDFGIAAVRDEEDEGITRDGTTLGTPSYMAPEQFEDSGGVDKRADIYSIGVMLYEMVTAQKPFPGGFTGQALARIQRGRYESARKINKSVSRHINRLIGRCMRVKPGRRIQDLGPVVRTELARLKRFGFGDLRKRLIGAVLGERVEPVKEGMSGIVRILLATGVSLAVLLAAAAYMLFGRGYYYELFLPKTHGSLSISVTMLEELRMAVPRQPGEGFISASVFLDEGGDAVELEEVGISFRERSVKTDDYVHIGSRRIYLRSGSYRVKVNVGSEVFWNSFYLSPRRLQRTDPATRTARIIQINLYTVPQVSVDLEYRVIDEVTGTDITDRADGRVMLDGQWLQLGGWISRRMTTGNTYQLTFSSLGYYERAYELTIGPFENRLKMQIALNPEPGSVRITTDHNGMDLYLNGSRYYVSGGPKRVFSLLPSPSKEEEQVLQLPPGSYTLRAEVSSSSFAEITFNILSRMQLDVVLGYDRDSRLVDLHME